MVCAAGEGPRAGPEGQEGAGKRGRAGSRVGLAAGVSGSLRRAPKERQRRQVPSGKRASRTPRRHASRASA